MDAINKMHNRQLARFLSHLKRTGQLTPSLEVDVKRAYRFAFDDIREMIKGRDTEEGHDSE